MAFKRPQRTGFRLPKTSFWRYFGCWGQEGCPSSAELAPALGPASFRKGAFARGPVLTVQLTFRITSVMVPYGGFQELWAPFFEFL